THQLPFGAGAGGTVRRWSLVSDPGDAAPGTERISLPGAPTLVVEQAAGSAGDSTAPADLVGRRPWTARLAWCAIAFALLALAVMRGVGVALPGGSGPLERFDRRGRGIVPLALGGVLAAGAAASVPPPALAALLAGLALAAVGFRAPWLPGIRRLRPAGVHAAPLGALAVVLLAALAWAFERRWGPLDLAAGIVADPAVFSWRLAFAAAACGLLCLAGLRAAGGAAEEEEETTPHDRWAWVAVGLLAAAAALTDSPAAALALLAGGGAAAALWVERRSPLRFAPALAGLALLAALAAAVAVETAYRLRLDDFVGGELLSHFAPPAAPEVDVLSHHLADHFGHRDLVDLVPRNPLGLERQDLAFALWRSSPLARRNTLSALVVQPLAGSSSSFSFGLPLTREGEVDRGPARWQGLRLPRWEQALITGRATLAYRGVPWATARYWLLPRPGFEVADRRGLGEVEVGLLKGGPAASPVEEMPGPALYALYASDGRATISPWEESPPLDPVLRLRRPAAATVDTPDGQARAHARPVAGGWEAVYLPRETPLEALEGAATEALAVLLVLASATLLALLLALPRAAFRDLLRRAVRSYSKRLLIVYTALLLVPLLLLNVVLVRAMGARLEGAQQAAGEAALNSAQKELGDRILALQPGFGIDTALDDRVLSTLSQVVHHEVNLYWRSIVNASSKHELFTAGLLPKRIPGEIYQRLALLGYDLGSRTNRAGGSEYLELYAPLRVPGVAPTEERLFLSVPLLAQQAEGAAELAHLRRRALLVTAALFALSVAVGTRLARNFTQPLAQLVLGTRRIAAGAPSLDLAPSELELAALVEAVDQMARKIAEGRERLLREKQVVERMVENITSGVVSVDRERRVLMHNRVAAELLGVATGHSLERTVARAGRLAPVAAFLRSAGGEMARATVRLSAPSAPSPGAGNASNAGNGGVPVSGEGGEREWTLIWVPVPGPGEPAALLVVEDATETLRGQRLLAWAEMARIIAHEIKNPLTPIRLSAEHMREVYATDPEQFDGVFERCTANILAQVDELRSIASEFSAYSAIPRIDPRPGDLTAAIAGLVEGYRAAPPEGISVELESGGPIAARFDAKLLSRAVRNLLENALRASAGGGRVVVRVERLDGQARVSVIDSGPGVRPELLGRIFDPYFSTHDAGTGLGLPIARRIAEEHGGGITARNRAEGGLEVAITLPAG
ncbi:MAG TPA: ATP-binding protein, partial [Thermoanaerobaculia bacterium]|nr:ATP-binding protein [Thermoanaerobaculia bacterium]